MVSYSKTIGLHDGNLLKINSLLNSLLNTIEKDLLSIFLRGSPFETNNGRIFACKMRSIELKNDFVSLMRMVNLTIRTHTHDLFSFTFYIEKKYLHIRKLFVFTKD